MMIVCLFMRGKRRGKHKEIHFILLSKDVFTLSGDLGYHLKMKYGIIEPITNKISRMNRIFNTNQKSSSCFRLSLKDSFFDFWIDRILNITAIINNGLNIEKTMRNVGYTQINSILKIEALIY